ncbi:ATP-binding protein [Exiguobacterium sp. RIT452]|jgi:predicted kinase|uniref:AAA family ATPase n=1 Tax=Exiguobacterium sp. RIT452 TaxID=2315552 RepID=UPI000E7410BB|nr:ATP-binding protein [Exiguobacterium sp. RIT452]RJO95804.1 ATP-binding protein [Exiguobacterium sp. RIT452]
MRSTGTLYFFCGKMGAGKSTAAKRIVEEQRAVLLSEDEWLNALYPNQIKTFDDYLEYAKQMRPLVKQHVQHLLAVGVDVVMDFPANTKKQRKWFLDLVSEIDAHHQLIFLNRTNEQCLRQIAQRRQEQPERAAFDTEAIFLQVTDYFEVPVVSEGIRIVEWKGM